MRHVLLPILMSVLLAPALVTEADAASKLPGKPCLAKCKSIMKKGRRWTAFAINQVNPAAIPRRVRKQPVARTFATSLAPTMC